MVTLCLLCGVLCHFFVCVFTDELQGTTELYRGTPDLCNYLQDEA